MKAIELSYKENYFSFEFASLDFTDPRKNQYAYQLEGFDDDWIFCGSRRNASYTNLDGGAYRFKVKGTNHDGIWNEQSVSVQIMIHPPIWKTVWFRLGSIAIIIFLILAGVQWRFRSIKNQKRILEEQVHQRTLEVTEKNTHLQSALDEIQIQKNTLNNINQQLTQALDKLKQSQNQLIQSEKMAALGHLVGGIAHEINNPLSFVDGNLSYFNDYMNNAVRIIQEIETVLRGPEKLTIDELIRSIDTLKQKYDYQFIVTDMVNLINACKHGTQRIKKIIDDLRNFSTTDESQRIHSDIHQCIEQALMSLSHLYNYQQIEMIKEYGSLPAVLCFPGLLTQAFRHLLLNAIQAMDQNGTIIIQTAFEQTNLPDSQIETNRQDRIRIRISDNGKGIPEPIRHKIFDPFFTTKTVGQGTGLGLTIAYNIIKRHDGTVTCDSEEKRGSTFEIILPFNV
jgi:signal transduction histidine kinase